MTGGADSWREGDGLTSVGNLLERLGDGCK